MALTKVTRGGITADAVDGTKIADDAIDSEHYAATSVDNAHINDLAASKLTGALPAISGASLTGVGVDGISSSADATAITIDSSEKVNFNQGRLQLGHINKFIDTANYVGDAINIGSHPYANGTVIGQSYPADSPTTIKRTIHTTGTETKFFTVSGATETERVRIDQHGIKFNGDTAAANALSDYEEGTWTPTFVASDGANNPTISYTANSGFYTKVGNLVTINITTNTSSVSGGGSGSAYRLRINGLPFAGSDTSRPHATGIGLTHWGSITTDESLVIQVNTGTQLQLNYAHDGADVYTDALRTSSDSNQIKLSLTYATDS